MKHIILFLTFFLFALDAKEVMLTATIKYENSSNKNIKKAYHRVTIPSETFYQKILDIKVEGAKKYKIKYHKNGIDRYIKLYFNLPAHSKTVKKVHFIVDIQKLKLNLQEPLHISKLKNLRSYTRPSKYIESDSKQIKAIAYLIDKSAKSTLEKIKLAYEFTPRYLKFSDMSRKTTALSAIKSGKGDCTEYAFVFVSLLRALDIPARKTSYFSFKKVQKFSQPNHNEAEVFTDQYGWIPVYPNLSHGRYKNAFQFGNIADTLLLYKESNSWTHYGNISSKERVDESLIKYDIHWKIAILKE